MEEVKRGKEGDEDQIERGAENGRPQFQTLLCLGWESKIIENITITLDRIVFGSPLGLWSDSSTIQVAAPSSP